MDLLNNYGMTLVGTVRGNKKEVPEAMKKTNREVGSSVFLFTKDITFVSFLPDTATAKKAVLLMSFMHTQASVTEGGKPEIIKLSNKTKGAVDTFDQMCAKYSCWRKTERWPLCLFYTIINAAVISSWIIYRDSVDRVSTREERLHRKVVSGSNQGINCQPP